jgi:hypothetical protein
MHPAIIANMQGSNGAGINMLFNLVLILNKPGGPSDCFCQFSVAGAAVYGSRYLAGVLHGLVASIVAGSRRFGPILLFPLGLIHNPFLTRISDLHICSLILDRKMVRS